MADMIRLGDVATYINGFPFKPEDRGNVGLPIIRIQDLTGNAYDLGFFDGDYPSRIEINDGDILISWSGSLGVYVWNRGKALLNQHIFKAVFDKVAINKDYYVFAVRYKLREMENKTHGATMKHIVKGDFDNTLIPFPSLSQQEDIARIMLSVASVIERRKCQLRALDQLIKARFVEIFGKDEAHEIPLKECCIDVRGGGTPSMQHPEYYGGTVPFIKSGDVRGDTVSSGALWLTEKALEETTTKYVPKGSVLVVNRSAALLREFRAAIASQQVVINQDIKAFIPKAEYTSEYLLWAIKIQAQLLLTKVTTVLTSHIDLKDLLELRIVPASIQRQNEFSAFVSQVDKSKSSIQTSLDQLETMKQSLMQKYFG